MTKPKFSIIIPVKNSAASLVDCLASIKAQTYPNIEIVVVDSRSTDNTNEVAKKFGAQVLQFQADIQQGKFDAPYKRNFGVENSSGKFVYYVDADMILPPELVAEIVTILSENKYSAVIVAEDSFGIGVWAQAKQLERRCYWGDDTVEAARAFKRSTWNELGGLDTSLGGGGDDWDLQHRLIEAGYAVARSKNIVLHNEGKLGLQNLMKKRFMYGRDSIKYLVKRPKASVVSYFPIRYAYIKNWRLFIKSPITALLFVIMRFCEYAAGFAGIVYSKFDYEK